MAIPTAQGGLTLRPQKAAGESDAAYQARLQAWIAGGSGVTLGGTGIPKPVYRAAGALVSPSGAVLGAFPVANADALPVPTRMGPFGRSEAGFIVIDDPGFGQGRFLPMPVAPPGRGPGLRRGGPSNGAVFRGPIGALPTSLREPTDPTPYDLERETALLATGYDPSWGTPPDRLGLVWDPVRFLYEPTNVRDGLPYAFAARDARYLQAVQRPDGTWSERWVLALAPTPDRDRPYRALDRAESSRLDAEVARLRSAESSYDARWKRGEVTRYEHPAIEFTPKYGPAKPAPKLSDFAWVGWRQIPVGCPYPYPAMPVPIQDYTSGRWLDEDYVPSIPLPSPYDQVPWRCGVPKQPGKPHKGGGGSPSEENTFPKQHSDLAAGAGSGASASSVLLDVGMPPPGGDIFLNRSPEDAPVPPPAPVDPPKKPCPPLIGPDGKRIPDGSREKDPPIFNADPRESDGPDGVKRKGVGSVVSDPSFGFELAPPKGSAAVGGAARNEGLPAVYDSKVVEFGPPTTLATFNPTGVPGEEVKLVWGGAAASKPFAGRTEKTERDYLPLTQPVWFGVSAPPEHELGFVQYVKEEVFLREDNRYMSLLGITDAERLVPRRGKSTGDYFDGWYPDVAPYDGQRNWRGNRQHISESHLDPEDASPDHEETIWYQHQAHRAGLKAYGERSVAMMYDAPGIEASRLQVPGGSSNTAIVKRGARIASILDRVFGAGWSTGVMLGGKPLSQSAVESAAKNGFLILRRRFLTAIVDTGARPCPRIIGWIAWTVDVIIDFGSGGEVTFAPSGAPAFSPTMPSLGKSTKR